MKNNMIEVKNVSMRFNLGIEKGFSLKQAFIDIFNSEKRKQRRNVPEFWALKDVSFNVKKGEVVGFIGSNGAGKSTLLKVVAGVMKPTKGSVNSYGNICPMIELGAPSIALISIHAPVSSTSSAVFKVNSFFLLQSLEQTVT